MTTKKAVLREGARPRGRPRAFCEEAALEAAARAFAERGYDGVTVAGLCARVGIRPPSFYAAFGSKAALFERVVEGYAHGEGGALADALAGEDVATALTAFLEGAARAYARTGTGCLVMEAARGTAEAAPAEACAAASAATRARIEAYLEERGATEPARLAGLVAVALTGLSGAARQGVSEEVLVAFARIAAAGVAAEA